MQAYDLKVLSLGAGVQSTCLLLMALEGEIERPDCAIFADTGWEPKGVYEHLGRLQAKAAEHNFPIHVVSAGNIRQVVLSHIQQTNGKKWGKKGKVGQPPFYVIDKMDMYKCQSCGDLNRLPAPVCDKCGGMVELKAEDRGGTLWRQCTKKYKIEPITKKIREILGYKPRQRVKHKVQQWFGISLDEMGRMKESQLKWIDNYYPLIERRMDRHNCQQWLKRYGGGWGDTPKSACLGCPYHHNAQWRDIKNNDAEGWADVVAFDKALREKPYPGLVGKPYLHRDMLPIDEVDLSTDEDRGQMNLFGEFSEECEGFCGV
jgi:hypothetical protein